jgi:hypothetical protein
MFKRCKEIYKKVLQTKQDNSENISYRGKGLSNEYRLSLPIGLIGRAEATSFTRVFDASEKEV